MQHNDSVKLQHILGHDAPVKHFQWLDILTARYGGFAEELVLHIMEMCGFHGTGRLICTCHCMRDFFYKLKFISNVNIDTTWKSGLNVGHFREFVKFSESWPVELVRRQEKKCGDSASFRRNWEAAVARNTSEMSFDILTYLGGIDGMKNEYIAAGAACPWQLIWLAMCVKCAFGDNFGEFTYTQWLIITHPRLFEFLLRFVQNVTLNLSKHGGHNLNIFHCAAFQVELSDDCYNTIFHKLNMELDQGKKTLMRFLEQSNMHLPHFESVLNGECPEDTVVSMLMSIWLREIYFEELTEDEMNDSMWEGSNYNVVNICALNLNVRFLKIFMHKATKYGRQNNDENMQREMLRNLVNHTCDEAEYNNFHLLAIHANRYLNEKGSENGENLREFWNLLKQYGGNVSDRTEDYSNGALAISVQLDEKNPGNDLTTLFFDELDSLPYDVQNTWLLEPNGIENVSITQQIAWAWMTERQDSELLFARIQPYAHIFNNQIGIINFVRRFPAWDKTPIVYTKDPTMVHKSDADFEYPLHFVVRFARYVYLLRGFGHTSVVQCIQRLLDLRVDKRLRDGNGNTAVELALRFGYRKLAPLLG